MRNLNAWILALVFVCGACADTVTLSPMDMQGSEDTGQDAEGNNGVLDMGDSNNGLDMEEPPDMEADLGEDMDVVVSEGPTRYDPDLLLSPFSKNVVENLQAIRGSVEGPDDHVFMKVGASGTVNSKFLDCFSGTAVDLAGRVALQPTIDYFGGPIAGGTAWDRDTLAAVVGRTASWVQSGNPSPLASEIAAINPRFALVNYGTNDMQAGTTHQSALWPFWNNMWTLLTGLMAEGIIPIVTGLNPRGDTAQAALWVPSYNEVTRAMAQTLQLPYLDLYNSVVDLPDQGLISDGLHGNGSPAGACVFDTAALQYNYNVRNLSTLELLGDVRTKVIEGQTSSASAGVGWAGVGTVEDPMMIDRFPFSHSASTIDAPSDVFDAYPACSTGQDESGGEVVYKFTLASSKRLRIMVFDESADIDIHHLQGSPTAAQCQDRDDKIVQGTFTAGDHYVVLDTFVGASSAYPGEYTMVVLECESGDSACD